MRIGPIWLADEIGRDVVRKANDAGRAVEVEASELIREAIVRWRRKEERQARREAEYAKTEAVA
jgi:hypothetical protein